MALQTVMNFTRRVRDYTVKGVAGIFKAKKAKKDYDSVKSQSE